MFPAWNHSLWKCNIKDGKNIQYFIQSPARARTHHHHHQHYRCRLCNPITQKSLLRARPRNTRVFGSPKRLTTAIIGGSRCGGGGGGVLLYFCLTRLRKTTTRRRHARNGMASEFNLVFFCVCTCVCVVSCASVCVVNHDKRLCFCFLAFRFVR